MVGDDEEQEPSALVLCVPEDWAHTQDSALLTAHCGHRVWISPAGQQMVSEGAEVICLICAKSKLEEGEVVGQVQSVPGALEAVDREFGEAARARAEAMMKRWGIKPNR